jgi:hypothetical protein
MDMDVQIPIKAPAFTSFSYIPRSGIAGSYDSFMFNFFCGTTTPSSRAAAVYYILTSSTQDSSFSMSSTLIFFCLFVLRDSHPKGCKVVSCCV